MQMTALSNARNTTEILCHTQKLHRTRTVKDNTKIYTGSMVAINGSTNKAEPAADAAGLIVIGRAEGFTADGRVIAKSGVFKFDNASAEAEKLTHADINKTVYAIDDHTVGKAWAAQTRSRRESSVKSMRIPRSSSKSAIRSSHNRKVFTIWISTEKIWTSSSRASA